MALFYTTLGVAVAFVGQSLGAWLQRPWGLGAFAMVRTMFATTLIVVVDIKLPHRWTDGTSRASRRERGGKLFAVGAINGQTALCDASSCSYLGHGAIEKKATHKEGGRAVKHTLNVVQNNFDHVIWLSRGRYGDAAKSIARSIGLRPVRYHESPCCDIKYRSASNSSALR